MRVGISIPEKLLKWRKSLFALEVLALGNWQRIELFGDHMGVVRNWNAPKQEWMETVYCENTRESQGDQIEEPELGLRESGKSPGTFDLSLFGTKYSLNAVHLSVQMLNYLLSSSQLLNLIIHLSMATSSSIQMIPHILRVKGIVSMPQFHISPGDKIWLVHIESHAHTWSNHLRLGVFLFGTLRM